MTRKQRKIRELEEELAAERLKNDRRNERAKREKEHMQIIHDGIERLPAAVPADDIVKLIYSVTSMIALVGDTASDSHERP